MPDRTFGSDSLAAPIYLANGHGADDPGLAAWKQEHPNWMVAGTWTPAPRAARIMPPTPDQDRAAARPDPNASFSSLDPATISVADFRHVADKPDEPTLPPKAHARSSQAYPDNNYGPEPSAPTNSIKSPYPASTPETMVTGGAAESNSMPSEPPSDWHHSKTNPPEAR